MRRSGSIASSVGVAVLSLTACVVVLRLFWLAGLSSLDAVTASGPDNPADLLVVGAAAAGGALTAWLGLGIVLSALGTLPGAVGRTSRLAADRLAPAVVRRGVALLLGSALAAAAAPAIAHADGGLPVPTLTSSAQTQAPPAPDPAFGVTGRGPAVDAPQPTGPAARSGSSTAPDPAFTAPATPSGSPSPVPAASTPAASAPAAPDLGPLGQASRPAAPHTTVTVVRGDSLWRIAARHLGGDATNLQIAREWPRWYAANRLVIGLDPDVIHPGQVLTVPVSGPTPEGGPS